jgi:hypothetical protein
MALSGLFLSMLLGVVRFLIPQLPYKKTFYGELYISP